MSNSNCRDHDLNTGMKPEVRIFQGMEDLSRDAASLFAEQAAQSIAERNRFLVALSGGKTPARFHQMLADDYREQVDWSKVHVFWGDERCVPPDDKESNYGQVKGSLLNHVPIPDTNIHRIKGELELAEATGEYALTLRRFASVSPDVPRFDLVYLGMGEDGHTASLFPGQFVNTTELVIPVTAHYQDRPANRVSLTPIVFNNARLVVFIAVGERKAVALAEVLSGRHNPDLYPAQRVAPKEGKIIWLVERHAASGLTKKVS